MSKYYGDLITDDFFDRINRLKSRLISNDRGCFIFIFVNAEECESVIVEEQELENTEIKDQDYTNIVVLLRWDEYYMGFTNRHFKLIGIFDRYRNIYDRDECIRFKSIAITSFDVIRSADHGYNTEYIKNCSIKFICPNPFKKYQKRVLVPIVEAINRSLPKDTFYKYGIEQDDYINNIEIATTSVYHITEFDKYLRDVRNFDESFTKNLIGYGGESLFNPDDYMD